MSDVSPQLAPDPRWSASWSGCGPFPSSTTRTFPFPRDGRPSPRAPGPGTSPPPRSRRWRTCSSKRPTSPCRRVSTGWLSAIPRRWWSTPTAGAGRSAHPTPTTGSPASWRARRTRPCCPSTTASPRSTLSRRPSTTSRPRSTPSRVDGWAFACRRTASRLPAIRPAHRRARCAGRAPRERLASARRRCPVLRLLRAGFRHRKPPPAR